MPDFSDAYVITFTLDGSYASTVTLYSGVTLTDIVRIPFKQDPPEPVTSWDHSLQSFARNCACGECGMLGANAKEYVSFSFVTIDMKCWRCGYEWEVQKSDVPKE